MSLQEQADQFGIGSIYRNGGTQNVKVEISGNDVSLSAMDATSRCWFSEQPVRSDSAEQCYLCGRKRKLTNYVLYNTAGTINDSTLINVATGENCKNLDNFGFWSAASHAQVRQS